MHAYPSICVCYITSTSSLTDFSHSPSIPIFFFSIEGEAAQFGSSQMWSREDVKEGEEAEEEDVPPEQTKRPPQGGTFPVLTFDSKEEYLEEIDALLHKAVAIFADHNELSMFPYYEARSAFLHGKVLAVRSKMTQEALEMVSLLLPDKDDTPFARRDQVAARKAEKVKKLAKDLQSFREDSEAVLKLAYQANKKFYGTHFHRAVTECLIALLGLLNSQPAKRKEVIKPLPHTASLTFIFFLP